MNTKSWNVLLVEILMAMLFFALGAAIALRVFVDAGTQSIQAQALSTALFEAQNLVEELRLREEMPQEEAVLLENGCTLQIETEEEPTAAGVLRRATVQVLDPAGETVASLPCARYFADEEAQP